MGKESPKNRPLADIIKHDGIKAKGFGTIPKFVTHDPDLTIESKGIYGYHCSLCGNGVSTYPSRDTILHALNLSKNGYYKHYKLLIEHGYIKVEKSNPADVTSHNIYTIVSNPPKLMESIKQNKTKVIANSIDLDSFGYGILPRAVMIDERLDIKAKGIYCYMASYAGAGNMAFPEKKNILYHLQISEKTYYRYLNQLIQYNYIIPIQRRDRGNFGVCDYILNQRPDEVRGAEIQQSRKNRKQPQNTPIGKKKDTIKHMEKSAETTPKYTSPIGKKGDSTTGDSTKGDGKNGYTIINSVPKNSTTINSIYHYQAATPLDTTDSVNNKINIINVLSKQEVANKISLDELKDKHPDNLEEINALFDCICDVLTVDNPVSPTLRISKQNTHFMDVKNMFLKLTKRHIEYVLRSLNNNDNKFKINKNTTSYLMTALFHSDRTISYYFDRKFNKPPQPKSVWDDYVANGFKKKPNPQPDPEPDFPDIDFFDDFQSE